MTTGEDTAVRDRDVELLDRVAAAALRGEVGKRIVGQREVVDGLLTAPLANGHALLVGVPGLAKTLLVSPPWPRRSTSPSSGSTSLPTSCWRTSSARRSSKRTARAGGAWRRAALIRRREGDRAGRAGAPGGPQLRGEADGRTPRDVIEELIRESHTWT